MAPSAEPMLAPFDLRHTNVSQPTLHRVSSLQSVTASEDYYSLSSESTYSSDSQRRARLPQIQRHSTPPSRYRTPMASGERLPRDPRDQSTESSLRGTGRRRHSESVQPNAAPNPLRSNPRTSPVRRKPVPSTVYESSPRQSVVNPSNAQSSAAMEIGREQSPPTPGMDDTPYIHFALDQLTRDEEVRGSRMYSGQEGQRSLYMPAREQAVVRPLSPPEKARRNTYTRSPIQEYGIPVNNVRQADSSGERIQEPQQPAEETRVERPRGQGLPAPVLFPEGPQDAPTTIPPRHPGHSVSPGMRSRRNQQSDLMIPFEPEIDSMYQQLNSLPKILRPLRLGLFITCLLLFLTALIFTAIWSLTHSGLWEYSGFGDARYFVFQYLPTLVGMILLLWLFEIEIAVYRVAPFIALASQNDGSRSCGALLPIYPSGFALPNLAHLKAGQLRVTIFLFMSWSTIFTIPLLATSFNVYFVNNPDRWMWLATQGILWTVIILYVLLLIATILLALFLHSRPTGLKWDPRSIADLLVLFERSNLLDTYATHRSHENDGEFAAEVSSRGDRLGYWHSSQRPNEIYHTLGIPNQPARRYSAQDGRILEKPSPRFSGPTIDPESGRPYSHDTKHSLLTRRSDHEESESVQDHLPWFLKSAFTLFWALTAIVLLIAFLVVSYLPATAIRSGFLPDLPVPVNPEGFSSANFLYSFIPALLGTFCFVFWYGFDLTLRRLQPFASLSHAAGALAEHSLLTSYTADGLFVVSLKAAANRHLRVAYVSLTTLIAAALPILAGGVFWAQFYVPQQRVRVSGHMPAFYAMTALLVIYALSYLVLPILPKHAEKYSLPNNNHGRRLLDIISLAHQSRLLTDAAFRAPATKTALVTRLLAAPAGERLRHISGSGANKESGGAPVSGGSKVSLADSIRGYGGARQAAVNGTGVFDTPRYGLGQYIGRDGERHVGIDRVARTGVEGMIVREV